jgi:glucodextranase-like protein
VLSDVYSPTIENSDDGTLQCIVTDGRSFTALQQRDMTYTVSSPDPSGMCRVTSTDAAHGFRLVTDYLTDPARDSVVMRTRLLPLHGGTASVAGLKVCRRRGPVRAARVRAAGRAAGLGDGGGLRGPHRGQRHGSGREHRGDRGGPARGIG